MSSQPGKAKQVTDRRRRRHPRFRSEFPVRLELLAGQDRREFAAHCKDLSEAGIGVLIAEELTLGEVVSLTFTLPGRDEWNVAAVLRHRRGYHYGCEFLSFTDEKRKELAEHLRGRERADSD